MKDLIFSPSEFAFGYSACKRCYYDLKIDNLRVSTPFPSIFSKLDRLQKEFYHEKSTDILNANIEPGKIKTDYEKLQKSEILKDKKNRSFSLRGKIDAYVEHDGFFSIIDFKVTDIDEQKIELYKTQLLSYAVMFEKPNEKGLKLSPIKNLGIFCFEPNKIQSIDNNQSKNQYVNQFLNEIKKDVNVIDSMLPNNSPDALSGKPVSSKNKLGKWKVYGKNECGWTVKQKKYMD